MIHSTNKIINTSQGAKELGISVRRFQAMCQKGSISNAFKINREWAIYYPIEFSEKCHRYKDK